MLPHELWEHARECKFVAIIAHGAVGMLANEAQVPPEFEKRARHQTHEQTNYVGAKERRRLAGGH
jgi:hypothetical protein